MGVSRFRAMSRASKLENRSSTPLGPNFRKAAVADNMRLARGAIDRDDWLRGATFSLKNLAQLKTGEAELSALDLSMTGDAPTSDAYRRVRAALGKATPGGRQPGARKDYAPHRKPLHVVGEKGGRQRLDLRLCALG